MRKTVWTFGLIAGGVMSLLMLALLPFHDAIGFSSTAMVIGYTTMVLGFLFVYFGVRSYRDTVGNGQIGFGRAFAVGILIVVVASLCYVATWEVIYYRLTPDFAAKYEAYELAQVRSSGASEAEIAKRTAQVKQFSELYKNPVINAAMTFVEPLPVGVVMALVAAGVLRRKRRDEMTDEGSASPMARAAP